MAKDGSLIFDTRIDEKGFKKGVSALKSSAGIAAKTVVASMVAATAAVVGIGVASAKVGSNFKASMSQVAATMGITVDEINKGDKSFKMLEKAAKDAGKTTQFSASQSAEALNYLALAGYDAEKSVKALPTVLNLAAAGGLDLAYASDLVTDSMSALGLETSQLEGFTDELAKTSQKSNTSVSQLGEAILTVGGTAKKLKGGTVELNTQLGILADNGIKGSEGGTALRNVLLALGDTSGKSGKQLKKLGISAYDANGNFRSTDDIFQDLNKTLGNMTEKERTEVLSKLFNKVDLKSANALLSGSGDRFNELSNQIANADGAAADMAETMNDNLLGKIEIMKSALEGLGITIYEDMDSPLKGVVETLTGYIDKINSTLTAHDDIKQAMKESGMSAEMFGYNLEEIPNGFEGAAEVIGEILADILLRLSEGAPRLLELGVNLINSLLEGLRANLPQISESAITLIQTFISSFLEILPEVLVLGIELIANLATGIAEMLPELIPIAISAIDTIINALMENLPTIIDSGVQIMIALAEGISGNIPSLMTKIIELVIMIADKIIENLPLILNAALQMIMALAQGIIDNLPTLIAEVPRIINSFSDAIYGMLPTIIATGVKIIIALIKGLIQSIPTLVANIPAIILAIVNVFTLYNWWNLGKGVILKIKDGILAMKGNIVSTAKSLAQGVINAIKNLFSRGGGVGKNFISKIANGIRGMASSIASVAKNLAKGAVSAIKNTFSNVGSIGTNLVKGIWNGINNAKGWVLSKIKGFGKSITKGIKNIFGIKSPSTVMRDEVGENITLGVGVGIEKGMPELSRDVDSEMSKLTRKMKATVDLESSDVGTKITATNDSKKYNVVTTNNDDTDEKVVLSGDIHATFEIDGEEIATATAPYTSKEIAIRNKRRKG